MYNQLIWNSVAVKVFKNSDAKTYRFKFMKKLHM